MSHTTPTVVLVHGAFAESASWNAVIERAARPRHRRRRRRQPAAKPQRRRGVRPRRRRRHRRPGPARRALLRRHGHHPGGRRTTTPSSGWSTSPRSPPTPARSRLRPLRQVPRAAPSATRSTPTRPASGGNELAIRPRCLPRTSSPPTCPATQAAPDGRDPAARDPGRARRRASPTSTPAWKTCRPGSCSASRTSTSPPPLSASMAERAGAGHPTRSPARRTPSASRDPRWSRSSSRRAHAEVSATAAA